MIYRSISSLIVLYAKRDLSSIINYCQFFNFSLAEGFECDFQIMQLNLMCIVMYV
jgi:hypothetical protein